MSWSCYMQDLAELIEDQLLAVDCPSDSAARELIDHSGQQPHTLSASTLEALTQLDVQDEAPRIIGLGFSQDTKDSLSISISDLASIRQSPLAEHFTIESSPASESTTSDLCEANLSTASPLALHTNTNNSHPEIALIMSPPLLDDAPEAMDIENVSFEAVKSALTPASVSTLAVDTMAIEASQESASTRNSTATALATRTTEDVIADLRQLRPMSKPDPPKRRKIVTIDPGPFSTANEPSSSPEYASPDSDDDEYNVQPTRPRKISERKRIMNATIDDYVRQRTIKETSKGTCVRTEDEANQSARWLINQSENRQIIATPREYQIELFERAKEKNIIAVLDTGSGKTLIAVLLLRHTFAQELEDRALRKPGRISFFLVDSVTLVFQQHAVLKANLDQPMNMFCGDMGCDLWNQKQWEKHFKENMVIVCTAEVLRQCLHHSFISIDRINLLIFDEAHHAKKDHTYARIIKDFYAQAPSGSLLPKIFGMTASPVDARVDLKKAALELEGLLHSQICTIVDPELAKYTVSTSQEMVARYAPLRPKVQTTLFSQMRERFERSTILRKPLIFAHEASRELGTWCADQVWPFCLSDEEFKKLSAKTERLYHTKKFQGPIAILEKHILQLQEARDIVKAHNFEPPDFDMKLAHEQGYTSKNLSSKVVVLVRHLKERFQRPTDDKCIIFVKQRYTARLLASLLSHPDIGTPHLLVGPLVGTRTGEAGDLNVSFREQVITMRNFRKGILNCLIATSVAEEGLDIPDCNLVIRFDLYDTLIQYIQSRGRARHSHSRYVHMIEHGNQQQENIVLEVRRNEGILKRFCSMLDDDRKLTGSKYGIDHFLKKERTHRVYTVKSTGAKLNYKMSLMILANFVDSLPRETEGNLQAEYISLSRGKDFECEVILPESSPVRGAVGRPASTKQVAKCSAAFEACLELIKGKYLDENLLPIFAKKLPAMRNAALAVDSKKREQYKMRTKPMIWSYGGIPENLFLTIITLDYPACLGRPSQPLAILTRSKPIQLPSFVLHFGGGKYSSVNSLSLDLSIAVNSELLAELDTFTLCLFDDVFSKQYQSDPPKMPYFIAPILAEAEIHPLADPSTLIDWNVLRMVKEHQDRWSSSPWENKAWKTEPDEFFSGRFIVDPFDGSRKLFLTGVATQYKPLDAVPEDTAPRKGARKNNSNIMEYSISMWASSRAKRTFDENQRVFEAQVVSMRRNLLDEFHVEDKTPNKCFIVLEALKISCLPATVVAMVNTFPAVIHRIESYLIALEAAELIHLSIRPDLALEACTKDSDKSGEHDAEQINFQRGMGKNYERLEFIGDCFLKMATSISLYGLFPGNDEYRSHVDRMCLLCNANLCNNAIKLKLYEYIRSEGFSRRAWYPEGLVLKKGKRATAATSHALGDKSIADVSEALIGAALVNYHESKNMDSAVRAVTELVCSENHNVKTWSDYYKLYQKPKYQLAVATAMQKDMAAQVEKKHAYHFKYPRLLRSSFTHPSYPFSYEHIPSYQRLEFLGDSLLDMACVNFLFYNYPTKDPQWLTEHKMAMASNQFLGALCVQLEFHTHLLSLNVTYQKQIKNYVEEIQEARVQAENDAVRAGKSPAECAPDYWTIVRQPPKCLPDIVEAYVGAIFVDSEYDYSEVERFFDTHIRWFFEDMSIYDSYANKHPTTFLTTFLQTNMGCVDWSSQTRELVSLDGLKPQIIGMVILHGNVIAEWTAESGRYAKVGAAKKALEELKGLPIVEFREMYGCTCMSGDGVEEGDEEGEEVRQALEDMHGTAV